jgi:hypothetical protein
MDDCFFKSGDKYNKFPLKKGVQIINERLSQSFFHLISFCHFIIQTEKNRGQNDKIYKKQKKIIKKRGHYEINIKKMERILKI